MHPLEDRSFRFSVDEFGISVYGVFDGFGGSQVINEISQRAINNKKGNIKSQETINPYNLYINLFTFIRWQILSPKNFQPSFYLVN